MAYEFRRVELSKAARENGVNNSTYQFNNLTYRLYAGQELNVPQEVATAWTAADANVVLATTGTQ